MDIAQGTDDDTAEAFEIANLRPAKTGLPFVVFVSQQGGARHAARIKLSALPRYDPTDTITVTLEDPPRTLGPISPADLAQVRQWIELNRATLEAYWDGRIAFTEDMLAQIQPL